MKLIIFDFDGTLADTEALITQTMMKTVETLQLGTCSRQECKALIGLPLVDTFMRLMPMTEETAHRCARTYEEIFKHDNREGMVSLFPEVRTTLQALSDAGLTLTIATSRQRFSLLAFLRSMNIEHLFGHIVTVNDVERAKPFPDMVIQTMEQMQVAPADTLMVGDAVYDIEMGVNAGVHTCAVTYGNGTRSELKDAGAEHLIDHFGQLKDIIL